MHSYHLGAAGRRIARGWPRALVAVLGLGGCGLASGCARDVLVAHPAVRFTEPRGAVLFVLVGGAAVRARFGEARRTSPVVCAATRALLDVRRRGRGRRYVLRQFASRPGFARVQLHDKAGRLLARGRLCVFPTLRPLHRSILGGYTIGVPPGAMRRLRTGRPVALYQSYRPWNPPAEAYWQHVAWVLYLDPRQ